MAEEKIKPRFTVREASEVDASVTVIELSGQLDAHTAPEFERFLEDVVRDEGKRQLVLDFHGLEYISSAGLGVLMGLIEEVRATGGDMKLAALPEKIFHVLDLLGFPMVFQIFPTVAEAEAAFK
ncbi:MAG TPA: STAS domain-containing protein [Candidatus Kapabacteria bacterium]|nr:STAS domain-containing protein [Candidatus Kapabacteria bacterium]